MADANLVTQIEALEDRLAEARASIARRFIGQERVVDLTLSALLCGGHALLVGLPGLGKTRLVDTLARVMGLQGGRIQFTPDLMPADILGSEVLETAQDGTRSFRFIGGPIFCQLLVPARVGHLDVEHEAVELSLGQGISAFLLNRVLCRQDEERLGQMIGLRPGGYVMFLHGL